jgi:hypothetical protein
LSRRSASDWEPSADPQAPQWKDAPAVVAAQDRYGKPMPAARTEIRSRWTPDNLYFLFSASYESMYLKPSPIKEETWGLWDFDVVEVFIGYELDRMERYKEFEVSPMEEWVDLDVDRARKDKAVDWRWDSGFRFRTRIDTANRKWYCEMRIPWKSIEARPVKAGNELRLNLYRIEGAPPDRKYITWRAVNAPSFHTPEAFGRLRLTTR